MGNDELKAWLRLTLSPGVGNETARKLLAAFGSAQAVFTQDDAALRQLGTEKLRLAIRDEPPALAALLDTTLEWLSGAEDRAVAVIGDERYPPALLDIEDPPLMLYMLGAMVLRGPSATKSIATQQLPNIGMVGSRNPTPQGEINAREFARFFGASGLCVVSGLALGIDGAAHDGALLGGGTTIAVVGTGLDRVYPKRHLELAHRIAGQGMIISEFPLGTPPLNANFPKRNRIISGLSQGVLVVEAALKSGSLITARLATEQGKDVFAIPGSIHSPQSRGCHWLIKQGAKLVETAQDVLEELRLPAGASSDANAEYAVDSGRPEEDSESDDDIEVPDAAVVDRSLMNALGFDIVSLDALQARTGIATPELQGRLLELELDGMLTRLPGGLFQRIARG